VGLVQRVLEANGLATVALSMIPVFTKAVGVPRIAAIGYPMSRPMGKPHDADGQRAVLRCALNMLTTATEPGTIVELPYVWPETRAQAAKGSHVSPPIGQLLMRKPWLIPKLVSGDIPNSE